MNIKKEKVDNLNIALTVEIKKDDYIKDVEKDLKDYRKRASIPGFRKGAVPMNLLKKQYGKSLISEKINSITQKKISEYLKDEDIKHMGYPIPRVQENLEWEETDFSFTFDLGLLPSFKINFKPKKTVVLYQVEIDEKEITQQVDNLRNQYGKYEDTEALINDNDLICANIVHQSSEIDLKDKRFSLSELTTSQKKKFKPLKKGDKIEVKTRELFENKTRLQNLLDISEEKIGDINTLSLEIVGLKKMVQAELNQEFYDKAFGKGKVSSEEDLKKSIGEKIEQDFQNSTNSLFQNDFIEALLRDTKFSLPDTFLKKWIQFSGEKTLTEEEAKKQFESSEQSIRYQLIENNIIETNNIEITDEAIKNFITEKVKIQMESYGQFNIDSQYLKQITDNVFADENQFKYYKSEFLGTLLTNVFKEKGHYKTKKITKDKYLEILKKEEKKKK